MENQGQEEIKVSSDRQKLDQYQDLSGLTIKKLNFGLWYVENIKFIKLTFFWLIIAIGAIGWFYTVGSFGYYMIIGMNKDNEMLRQMVATRTASQTVSPPVDIIIGATQTFIGADGRYDFALDISNPNSLYYGQFDYSFLINGSSTSVQKGFVLPGENKRIVMLGLGWPGSVNTVNAQIGRVSWQKINRHQIPNWQKYKKEHLALSVGEITITSPEQSDIPGATSMSGISFNFANQSPYSYYRLPLNIFIYSYDRLAGVYQTSLDNFASSESRLIRLSYPGYLDDKSRIEVVPELDIMRPDIYFKVSY